MPLRHRLRCTCTAAKEAAKAWSLSSAQLEAIIARYSAASSAGAITGEEARASSLPFKLVELLLSFVLRNQPCTFGFSGGLPQDAATTSSTYVLSSSVPFQGRCALCPPLTGVHHAGTAQEGGTALSPLTALLAFLFVPRALRLARAGVMPPCRLHFLALLRAVLCSVYLECAVAGSSVQRKHDGVCPRRGP